MVSPTTAVPWVFVKVVPLNAVPVALVLHLIVPPVTVNPVVVLDAVKVYQSPLAAVGKVQDGLPLVEALLNVRPDCVAVKTTVAPTAALSVFVLRTAPDGIPAVKTGAAVKVATPVKEDDPVTAAVPVTVKFPPNAASPPVFNPLYFTTGT